MVERALEHYETNKARHELEQVNKRLSARLQEMTRGVVRAIADTLEAKDEHVYGHARRVSGYAAAIARRLRLDAPTVEQIQLAALLHDIGKIGTPDSLLLKPSSLTVEERSIVQLHCERGARILGSVPEMLEVAEAIRYHHEHFDGSGYPEGLVGEQIPLAARIILVADAYDAMTSPRPFRQACDHDTALEHLKAEAGRQFDPEVVRAFCYLEALPLIRHSIARSDWNVGSSSPQISFNNLAFTDPVREVEKDPVLATQVLRAANSGSNAASRTINLQEACERIGEAEIRTILAHVSSECKHDKCQADYR